MTTLVDRIKNVAYAIDETVNALIGGQPRETISGTVGRAAAAGKWWAIHIAQPLINFIMMNPNHCQGAAKIEGERRVAEQGIE